MNLDLAEGNLMDIHATIKVNTLNGDGILGTGLAGAFRRACPSLQQDLRDLIRTQGHGFPAGSVMWTRRFEGYDTLKCEAIAHVITMRHPGYRSSPTIITQCLHRLIADLRDWGTPDTPHTIALSAWGTGVGRVPVDQVAKILISGIQQADLPGWTWIFRDPNRRFIEECHRVLSESSTS